MSAPFGKTKSDELYSQIIQDINPYVEEGLLIDEFTANKVSVDIEKLSKQLPARAHILKALLKTVQHERQVGETMIRDVVQANQTILDIVDLMNASVGAHNLGALELSEDICRLTEESQLLSKPWHFNFWLKLLVYRGKLNEAKQYSDQIGAGQEAVQARAEMEQVMMSMQKLSISEQELQQLASLVEDKTRAAGIVAAPARRITSDDDICLHYQAPAETTYKAVQKVSDEIYDEWCDLDMERPEVHFLISRM